MVIHAPRMACRPDIGVESGCQLVPEPSRLMEYGPSSPIMARAPASGSEGCAAAAGASAASAPTTVAARTRIRRCYAKADAAGAPLEFLRAAPTPWQDPRLRA